MKPFLKINLILAVSLVAFCIQGNFSLAATTNPENEEGGLVLGENISETVDMETRKHLLNSILDESKSEIEALKTRLEKLDLSDDEWKEIRDYFYDGLSKSFDYYNEAQNKINNNDIDMDAIKSVAKDLKEWRELNYTSQLKEITNFLFIFEEENLIKTSNSRLEKISADIKKIEKQRYLKTADSLKIYFAQAQKNVKNAEGFKNTAKDLFFKTLSREINPPEESPESEQKDLTADNEPEINVQDSITDLLKSSIKEIKSAYEIFFQMNNTIKKSL